MGLLTDIATLAKAGYTADQVKEILSIAGDNKQEQPAQEPQLKEEQGIEAPETKQEPEHKAEPDAKPENDVVDYKKLYEESQDALKKAQASNTNTDISNAENQTDEQILADFVRGFI